MKHAVRIMTVLLVAGCTNTTPTTTDSRPAPSPGSPSPSPPPAGTTLSLPPNCRPQAVTARLRSVVAALDRGDGQGLAAAFTVNTHWEVYQHFAPAPPLTSRAAIASFAQQTSARHDRWQLAALEPPVGNGGLPDTAVYAASITVRNNSLYTHSGAKVVIECRTGLIKRMVGPHGTA